MSTFFGSWTAYKTNIRKSLIQVSGSINTSISALNS